MELPLNGRIAIIDNNISEVKPLIDILSKKRIPFNYYSGELSQLPDSDCNNDLRILFLDLRLSIDFADIKTDISAIYSILNSIIGKDQGPYILIVWSKHGKEKAYIEALKKMLYSELFQHKSPVAIVYLNKHDYMDIIEEGNYKLKEGGLGFLANDINVKVNSKTILLELFKYENLIHKSNSDVIKTISSFYNYDEHWNKNITAVIYKLAKSILGRDEIKDANDRTKLNKGLMQINNLLFDSIEHKLSRNEMLSEYEIKDNGISEEIFIKLNTKIHTLNDITELVMEQGNLFLIPKSEDLIQKIINEKFFKKKTKDLLNSNPWLVMLDITPICDYSQDKDYLRMIYGVSLDSNLFNDVKGFKKDFHYQTPVFEINGQSRFILFDFRHILSTNKAEMLKRDNFPIMASDLPLFKFRREILSDIQSNLSMQVSRLGISIVE
jgi:hypothetical protein